MKPRVRCAFALHFTRRRVVYFAAELARHALASIDCVTRVLLAHACREIVEHAAHALVLVRFHKVCQEALQSTNVFLKNKELIFRFLFYFIYFIFLF